MRPNVGGERLRERIVPSVYDLQAASGDRVPECSCADTGGLRYARMTFSMSAVEATAPF